MNHSTKIFYSQIIVLLKIFNKVTRWVIVTDVKNWMKRWVNKLTWLICIYNDMYNSSKTCIDLSISQLNDTTINLCIHPQCCSYHYYYVIHSSIIHTNSYTHTHIYIASLSNISHLQTLLCVFTRPTSLSYTLNRTWSKSINWNFTDDAEITNQQTHTCVILTRPHK